MKAFLIPGNGEDLKSRDYSAVLKMYKSLGYEPQFVPITWKYKKIDDWIDQVMDQISEKEIQSSLLSGFSFGSMIAMGVAAKTNPKQLLLFSLSPYFKEDFPIPKSYETWAGKRKTENFRRYSFDELAAQIDCPAWIFLGSKEKQRYLNMWQRATEAHKKLVGSKMVLVEGAVHDVGDPKYVEAIRKALK